MSERSFKSFKEANSFAKKLAQQRGGVQLLRNGDEYLVVIKTSTVEHKIHSDNRENSPVVIHTSVPTTSLRASSNERFCIECGIVINRERLETVPTASRCVKCQSRFEATHDTRPHINEGIAGTREENKKMRGQLWGDILKRGK